MAYYYVMSDGANDGTATGDGGRYTTAKTGSWSTEFSATTEYYASWKALLATVTTAPTNGDVICFADTHSENSTTATVEIYGAQSGHEPIIFMSVDYTDCDAYKAGAEIKTGAGAYDLELGGRSVYLGMVFESYDWIIFNWSGTDADFYGCTLKLTNGLNNISTSLGNIVCRFYDCTFDLNIATGYIRLEAGARFEVYGGSVIFTSATNGDQLFSIGHAAGGAKSKWVGVDLSSVDGYLIETVGGDLAADDGMDHTFIGCKTNASLTGFISENYVTDDKYTTIINCSDNATDAEHQYFYQARNGSIEAQETIYRAETEQWNGVDMAFKCVTTSDASRYKSFIFELPSVWAELSSASTDTIRIYFACSNTLDDGDVRAELHYRDGTNFYQWNKVEQVTNPLNPFRTDGSLTADTGSDWRNGAGAFTGYEYYIDLDTSGDVGDDCAPIIRVFVGKASETIYFCPTVGVVA